MSAQTLRTYATDGGCGFPGRAGQAKGFAGTNIDNKNRAARHGSRLGDIRRPHCRHGGVILVSAAVCRTDARKGASDDHIARAYDSSGNGLLQHGHSPSYPLTRAENAVGCGRVVIALNASGARCA